MNLIKNTIAVVLTVFAIVSFAQTALAPAPVSPVVTAEQKAAVAEMLEVINFKQMMSQMGAAMAQSMPQMLEQTIGKSIEKLPTEQQQKAREDSKAASARSMKEMMGMYSDVDFIKGFEDIMARAYVKRFSLDEIKAITVFYKSDAGKKVLASGPQIMQESMPEMMALIKPRMDKIIEKTTKELIEKAEAVKAAEGKNAKPAANAAQSASKPEPAKK